MANLIIRCGKLTITDLRGKPPLALGYKTMMIEERCSAVLGETPALRRCIKTTTIMVYFLIPHTPHPTPHKGRFFTLTSGVGCGAWGVGCGGTDKRTITFTRGFPPLALGIKTMMIEERCSFGTGGFPHSRFASRQRQIKYIVLMQSLMGETPFGGADRKSVV